MKNVAEYMKAIDENSMLTTEEVNKIKLVTSMAREIEEIEESRDYIKLFCSHAIDTILNLNNSAFSLSEKDEMAQRIANACAKEVNAFDGIIKDIYQATMVK